MATAHMGGFEIKGLHTAGFRNLDYLAFHYYPTHDAALQGESERMSVEWFARKSEKTVISPMIPNTTYDLLAVQKKGIEDSFEATNRTI